MQKVILHALLLSFFTSTILLGVKVVELDNGTLFIDNGYNLKFRPICADDILLIKSDNIDESLNDVTSKVLDFNIDEDKNFAIVAERHNRFINFYFIDLKSLTIVRETLSWEIEQVFNFTTFYSNAHDILKILKNNSQNDNNGEIYFEIGDFIFKFIYSYWQNKLEFHKIHSWKKYN